MIDTTLFWQCCVCRKNFSIGLTTMRIRDESGKLARLCVDCDDERGSGQHVEEG